MATYKLVDSDKLDAAMTATADAIRAKTGGMDPIAWDSEKGMSEAVEGISADSYYDTFWDAYQANGKKDNYNRAFSSKNWTDEIYNPKYTFQSMKYAAQMFYSSDLTDTKYPLNFAESDTSVSAAEIFNYCRKLIRIRTITVNEKVRYVKWFDNCTSLEDLSIEGTIGAAIDLHWSPLSKASILSTITALSDSTSGLTASFSLTAVNTAFETTAGSADGSTSEEWTALIATKPNWTIALADA